SACGRRSSAPSRLVACHPPEGPRTGSRASRRSSAPAHRRVAPSIPAEFVQMRQSSLFGRTLREAPSEAQTPGHRLMLRAAIARQTAAGLYKLLPLGFRVPKKLEQIIREEMDAIGCQEMEMPVLTPAELWKETGRWDLMD